MAKPSNEPIILIIPCRFEGETTKRYGEVAVRFRIEEMRLPDAMRAVVGTERKCVAVIKHRNKKYPVGRVVFGGLRIDGKGESVLTLDSVADNYKLDKKTISKLADQDIRLVMGIK